MRPRHKTSEHTQSSMRVRRAGRGFNEAEAQDLGTCLRAIVWSVRVVRFNEAEAQDLGTYGTPAAWRSIGLVASMRPRHKTSEHDGREVPQRVRAGASMRPRHKTSEHLAGVQRQRPGSRAASMRPRHKTSEHSCQLKAPCTSLRRFNEAEAQDLGTFEGPSADDRADRASMRPRHKTSEHGRLTIRLSVNCASFNEAEAQDLGTYLPCEPHREQPRASMRPRHKTSEHHG